MSARVRVRLVCAAGHHAPLSDCPPTHPPARLPTHPLPTDPTKERAKVLADPARYTRRYEGVGRAGTPFAVEVAAERFLGPEIFFAPHLYRGAEPGQGGEAEQGQGACVEGACGEVTAFLLWASGTSPPLSPACMVLPPPLWECRLPPQAGARRCPR